MKWEPISTAPINTYVVIIYNSGYRATPYKICIAKLDPNFTKTWVNISDDRIEEDVYGWMEWEPENQEIPENQEYELLFEGDMIKDGDQMLRVSGEWVEINQSDIDSYEKVTGKPIYYRKTDLMVRRKREK